jgi:hypothetical protein
MGDRKMARSALTGEVATTATMAQILERPAALRCRRWTRGERGKMGGGVAWGPVRGEKR